MREKEIKVLSTQSEKSKEKEIKRNKKTLSYTCDEA